MYSSVTVGEASVTGVTECSKLHGKGVDMIYKRARPWNKKLISVSGRCRVVLTVMCVSFV